jgi:adenosylcobinamide-phosphate synthase
VPLAAAVSLAALQLAVAVPLAALQLAALQLAALPGSGGIPGPLLPVLLVIAACGLDQLLGDPRWCPHPVVVMGWWIRQLRLLAESWAADSPWRLRLAGGVITAILVGGSGLAGWALERWALDTWALQTWTWAQPTPAGFRPGVMQLVALALLVIALASALAGRSLEQAVAAVLQALAGDRQQRLERARQRLAWIVGRDTSDLDGREILRAAAETASENAVDGLFAPLFWMLVGAALWTVGQPTGGAMGWPGPLALAWAFKAASTLDSMLGYRQGRLLWLGTAGAKLDDLLTWLPCRLVALSLPLAVGRPGRCLGLLQQALKDGKPDPSPNAGVSQAAYAQLLGVQLGGWNRYAEQLRAKPLLARGCPAPTASSVVAILELTRRLEALWLALAAATAICLGLIYH